MNTLYFEVVVNVMIDRRQFHYVGQQMLGYRPHKILLSRGGSTHGKRFVLEISDDLGVSRDVSATEEDRLLLAGILFARAHRSIASDIAAFLESEGWVKKDGFADSYSYRSDANDAARFFHSKSRA